ncbi:MAG: hypothetical protein NC225_00445 [Clostridium sp.]|nr:hypothetical protein [Clostridium sp.]MCM1459167.1 hypothetical protein [Bacteroides sp.]
MDFQLATGLLFWLKASLPGQYIIFYERYKERSALNLGRCRALLLYYCICNRAGAGFYVIPRL